MHILYLHQYFCPPGSAGNNRSYELAKAWVDAGHQVTMVTSSAYIPVDLQTRNAGQDYSQTRFDGIDVHVLEVPYSHMMPFHRRLWAFAAFYRKLLRHRPRLPQPNIVYASSPPPSVTEAGRRMAARMQVPYIFEAVDVWPDVPIEMGVISNRFVARWLTTKTERMYAEAAAIVALSEGMRDQILRHDVPPHKVVVVHNGTNPHSFPFVDRRQNPAGCRVLYAGTVGRANGLDELLKAALEIQRRGHDDIRFEVLGGGNDLDRVKQLAREWQVHNVKFLPTIAKEQVPAVFARADVGFVCFAPHPVSQANSANKFYDYLASGLPVVNNYEGWQAEYLRQHQCGSFAPMGDTEGLVRAIIAMSEMSAEQRHAMGLRGRELAETRFDRRKLSQKAIEVFERVLAADMCL